MSTRAQPGAPWGVRASQAACRAGRSIDGAAWQLTRCGSMDPDQALRLTQSGGMLLLMDVPRGTEVGIDYQSWLTDSHFGGFKMIPPGIHWVFFRCVIVRALNCLH